MGKQTIFEKEMQDIGRGDLSFERAGDSYSDATTATVYRMWQEMVESGQWEEAKKAYK